MTDKKPIVAVRKPFFALEEGAEESGGWKFVGLDLGAHMRPIPPRPHPPPTPRELELRRKISELDGKLEQLEHGLQEEREKTRAAEERAQGAEQELGAWKNELEQQRERDEALRYEHKRQLDEIKQEVIVSKQELERLVALVGELKRMPEQQSIERNATAMPKSSKNQLNERDTLIHQLVAQALSALENEPKRPKFEQLSAGHADPTELWPGDWDVAVQVLDLHRKAENIPPARRDRYSYAYVNSLAEKLKRPKSYVTSGVGRLIEKGFIREVTFPDVLMGRRGRVPRHIFQPLPKLTRHFDFNPLSSPAPVGLETHMLLLMYATDYLAISFGAYVDACRQDVTGSGFEKQVKRMPDAFALFRRDELSWDTARALSIEAETPTSVANNKWTRQPSINLVKNFAQGFWGTILAAYDFNIGDMNKILDELPEQVKERIFLLKVGRENNEVSWEIPLPTRRKKIDYNALASSNTGL